MGHAMCLSNLKGKFTKKLVIMISFVFFVIQMVLLLKAYTGVFFCPFDQSNSGQNAGEC